MDVLILLAALTLQALPAVDDDRVVPPGLEYMGSIQQQWLMSEPVLGEDDFRYYHRRCQAAGSGTVCIHAPALWLCDEYFMWDCVDVRVDKHGYIRGD
jgi:hypothetical protein